jgi:diguanylate cyclase (GGDEF)-like protein/PAS domain S-box-containing protein
MQPPRLDDAISPPLRPTLPELAGAPLLGAWLVFALAYFALAQLGLLLVPPGGLPTPLWPPAGLAIAVLLCFGARLLPGVLLGELTALLLHGVPAPAALGAALGSLASAALALAVLRRLADDRPAWLLRAREVLLFIGVAAVASPILAAAAGIASVALFGSALTHAGWQSAVIWWLGHAAGVVLVGGALIAWLHPVEPAAGSRREFLLLFAANLVLAGAVFAGWLPAVTDTYPLTFLLLPGLLLAAFRLPARQVTLILLAVAVIAGVGTYQGFGPFAGSPSGEPQLLLQGFLLVLGAVTLVVRAVLAEREAVSHALAQHRRQLEQRVQQATAALRATNEQLEAERNFMAVVHDTVRNLVMVMDRGGRIVLFNRACQELTGRAEEEALGEHPWQLFSPPAEAAGRAASFAALRAEQFPQAYEDDWLTRGGERRRIEWSNTAILDEQGEVLYVVATGLDVTARRAAEVALARLNDHVRTLMEAAKEGILGVDREGRCTFINPAAAAMLGYPGAELVGRAVPQLLQPRHEDGSPYPPQESLILRAMAERQGFEIQDEVLWTRGGAALPVDYSVSPIAKDGVVSGAVVVFRNVAEARALARHLDYLASHDELTGLYNRRHFDRHLQQALELARDDGDGHVLCYLDLDQFKLVNDTCGHVAGDELLRQLGRELRGQMAPGDLLARLGGDEFGVLLHSSDLDAAMPTIERLRAAICDYRFLWEGRSFALGASIGVVQVTAETASVTAALSAADSACYLAKDSGRNRIHVYQDSDADLARRYGEMQWVSRLHAALTEERLFLVGQRITPTARQSSGLHLEVLVRLRDEDGREVAPDAFIPAAERYSLMPAIDRWVIRQTFAWLSSQPRLLQGLELCAINLSGSSVGDPGMRDYIVEQHAAHGIAARQICFEITETAAVANLASAADFVRDLRARGFRFALDDFGSGMSSFAYLKNLPVDYLKIDGNFVRDILTDAGDDAMVQAFNQIGHVMGLTTVAEFVESRAILDRLRVIGVDYAQGFGIARPQPVECFASAAELTG